MRRSMEIYIHDQLEQMTVAERKKLYNKGEGTTIRGTALPGIPKAKANAFAVPLGIISKGTSVLIKAVVVADTVPSPQEAIITSAPFSKPSRVSNCGSTSLLIIFVIT